MTRYCKITDILQLKLGHETTGNILLSFPLWRSNATTKGTQIRKGFFCVCVPHNCRGSIAAYRWGNELSLLHIFNHEHKAEAAKRNQDRLRKLKAHQYFLQETSDSYKFHNSPNGIINLGPNVQILLSILDTSHSTADQFKDVKN